MILNDQTNSSLNSSMSESSSDEAASWPTSLYSCSLRAPQNRSIFGIPYTLDFDGVPEMLGGLYSRKARLLKTTLTELRAIAMAAIVGGRRICKNGNNTPAAKGIQNML